MPDRENVIERLEKVSRYFKSMLKVGYQGDSDVYREHRESIKMAIELLKEQESEWLEDSDTGQEYGTTWACRKCHHSIHKPFVWNPYDSKMDYCPTCGARMVVNMDE